MNYINGGVVSATDIRKNWASIVKEVTTNKITAYVLSNNSPTVVILDCYEYDNIQKKIFDYKNRKR